jgi:tRNA A-37 threonylcarbamoyl transferase component Bud32/membrane-associated phospholipid phosphatase
VIWAWIFLSDRPAIWITEIDLELMSPIVDNRAPSWTPVMQVINEVGSRWAIVVIGWIVLVGALATRRLRHALLFIASQATIAGVVTVVAIQIGRPRPLGVEQIGVWEGYAQPSRPVALLTGVLVAFALSLLPPRPWRRRWYLLSAAVVAVFGFAQMYTGVDHPSDVLVSATIGVAVPLLIYRTLAPEAVFPVRSRPGRTAHLDVTGTRGEAIRSAMAGQLGIEAVEIDPIGLEGSAGSTPLRVVGADGRIVFAKLYSSTHLRSDRWYKLGRTLLYGRLEDEQRFTSVRRLVQHEHYMLFVFRSARVATQAPIGIVEITPDREYLLVTEFLEDAVEIGEVDVDTELIDQGLGVVKNLWRAGLAHRDIKPANVMVQGSRLRIIDVAFAQIRPSPWREAVDLANMMLVLALSSSSGLVHERARLLFTDDELAEAFAASRGVTMPSQLRSAIRASGRPLLDEFRALVPRHQPVSIQRWSLRRIGLSLWVGVIALALLVIFVSNLADVGLE